MKIEVEVRDELVQTFGMDAIEAYLLRRIERINELLIDDRVPGSDYWQRSCTHEEKTRKSQ